MGRIVKGVEKGNGAGAAGGMGRRRGAGKGGGRGIRAMVAPGSVVGQGAGHAAP